jgi:hypothetical protein
MFAEFMRIQNIWIADNVGVYTTAFSKSVLYDFVSLVGVDCALQIQTYWCQSY